MSITLKVIIATWALVALALIAVKALHAIAWSWWFVLIPIEIAVAILAFYVALFLGLAFFADWR